MRRILSIAGRILVIILAVVSIGGAYIYSQLPPREARLRASLPAIEDEPGTTAWFAVRLGPTSYAVFDVFPDEAARQAHLEAGRTRLESLADLPAEPPSIVRTEVIVAKLP